MTHEERREQILGLPPDEREKLVRWLLGEMQTRTTKPARESQRPGIERDPEVCGGEPRIAGTRIPVWLLERMRQLELSEAEILRSYPSLHAEDLVRAWEYVESNREEIEEQIRQNEEA